jgi:hypothetical protein
MVRTVLIVFSAFLLGTSAAFAEPGPRVELVTVGPDFAEWVIDTAAASVIEVVVTDGTTQQYATVTAVKGRLHRARIDGLVPGIEYRCGIQINGLDQPAGTWSPATFTTLIPPGNLLFRFATVTDTHVGEGTAGLVGGTSYTGFTWPDAENPYWKFTNEVAVREINEAAVDFVIHKGDLTAEAAQVDLETAKAIFDKLSMPWYPLRGNHDRQHEGVDRFPAVLGLDQTWRAFDFGGHRFLLLDSSDENGFGTLDEAQLSWVEGELRAAAAARQPTWVVLHNGACEESGFYSILGDPLYRLDDAMAGASPFVLGVLSGHSHRNIRLEAMYVPGVPFVETASTKEFPGMWTEVRVYSEGWMQIAHVIDCPECREWYDMTAGEYNGHAEEMQVGRLEDRCFVVPFDAALMPPPDIGPELAPELAPEPMPDVSPELVADIVAAQDTGGTDLQTTGGSGGCNTSKAGGPAGYFALLLLAIGLAAIRKTAPHERPLS